MSFMRLLTCWLLLFFVGEIVHAQTPVERLEKEKFFLALDKPGMVKRIRYYVGDEIAFYMGGDRWNAEILGIKNDTIIVTEAGKVPIKQIEAVVVPSRSWFLHQGAFVFPVAGVGYFLMDTLNPRNYENGNDRITAENITISSSLVGAGILCRVFRKKKYKINKRHLLKTIEVL
ncbi:hypothetical protein FHS56_002016 [Thermonema lapsum]|uniref:Uncharacterized protein n=1 Tax=Thermonema lapsum TaxID=28195 RepID=A0A846MST2_9BACT|nr:hypothetical protein [Thermonema lapsum]NIK74491.1 hypothetical protein [Thermonema lapsum]